MRKSIANVKSWISDFMFSHDTELMIAGMLACVALLIGAGYLVGWIGQWYIHASLIGVLLSLAATILLIAGGFSTGKLYHIKGGTEPFSEAPAMFSAMMDGMLFVGAALLCGFFPWLGMTLALILYQGWISALLATIGMLLGTVVGICLYPWIFMGVVRAFNKLKGVMKQPQSMPLC